MKNFSTVALNLAFATIVTAAFAPGANAAATTTCEFLATAPDQHVVVRGDTLWGISGKFLQHPWCWPQVWDLNREDIRNPHWIYPGQIVYFDRASGRLRLGNPAGQSGAANGDLRMGPHVRMEGLGKDAISTIPAGAIEPFLSQPLIIEEKEMDKAPRIVATQEGHVYLGKGDKAYVRGDLGSGTSFQAFRPGTPLKDPETKKIIGYEAVYLGTVKLVRAGKAANEAHSFSVVEAKQEMGVGDRLVPVTPTPVINYVPHNPETPVDARVVSIYGGVVNAGQSQVVSINRGKNDGVDIGTVLELSRFGEVIQDRTIPSKMFGSGGKVKLPDEKYGTLFIFRVFNNISYGLIMEVSDAVTVGDVAKSPE